MQIPQECYECFNGDPEKAKRHIREMAELAIKTLGPERLNLLSYTMATRITTEGGGGDPEKAKRHIREMAELAIKTLGPERLNLLSYTMATRITTEGGGDGHNFSQDLINELIEEREYKLSLKILHRAKTGPRGLRLLPQPSKAL